MQHPITQRDRCAELALLLRTRFFSTPRLTRVQTIQKRHFQPAAYASPLVVSMKVLLVVKGGGR